MAFEDYKITSADLNGKGVIGLPDAPQLSAEDMQNKFEETARDVIIPRINTVLEKMDEVIPPISFEDLTDGDTLIYDEDEGAYVNKPATTDLASLTDVDLTGLTNGDYIRYDYFDRKFKPTHSTVTVASMADILDVNISSPTENQALVYDNENSMWKNGAQKIDSLANVTITLPQPKQILGYDSQNDIWKNVDLDGGGHKIENASGTELTQREVLKFNGYLKATDDGANQKTIIDDSPTEVTWANWQTFTPEQKAGKKWKITNVPSADGTVTCELMPVLWTNPDTTVNFASQSITLNSDDYDMVLVNGFLSIGGVINRINCICEKNTAGILHYNYMGTSLRERRFAFTDETHISFSDCYLDGSVNNAACIPVEIYGLKKTPTFKFSAIAHDVKTDASNCMMSDGVTSVESALNGLYASVNVDKTATISGNGDVQYTRAQVLENTGISSSKVLAIILTSARPASNWTEVHPVGFYVSQNDTWGVHNYGTGGSAVISFEIIYKAI